VRRAATIVTRVISMAAVLAAATAGIAAADTVELPERPDYTGVLFADHPALVDPHPLRAESWSRLADEHAIAVHFTTGTPQCYGVHATVTETPDAVVVDLQGGTLPEAAGRACIMIAVAGSVEVGLQQPVGDRKVLAGSQPLDKSG